jgi:hypothetical protein
MRNLWTTVEGQVANHTNHHLLSSRHYNSQSVNVHSKFIEIGRTHMDEHKNEQLLQLIMEVPQIQMT